MIAAREGEAAAGLSRRTILTIVIGGVVLVVLGGLLAAILLQPERVDPASYVPNENQPQQVSVNEPATAAPADADLSEAESVSAALADGFAGDLVDVRSRAQGEQRPAPTTVVDQCLLDWAKANLAELAAEGAYEVVTVCERPTAVLAGPAGADSKVLVYGSLEETAPEGMREIIAESTSDTMAFVAVRTADGEAQLLAAAELSD